MLASSTKSRLWSSDSLPLPSSPRCRRWPRCAAPCWRTEALRPRCHLGQRRGRRLIGDPSLAVVAVASCRLVDRRLLGRRVGRQQRMDRPRRPPSHVRPASAAARVGSLPLAADVGPVPAGAGTARWQAAPCRRASRWRGPWASFRPDATAARAPRHTLGLGSRHFPRHVMPAAHRASGRHRRCPFDVWRFSHEHRRSRRSSQQSTSPDRASQR